MSTVIKLKYSAVTAQPADDTLNLSEQAYSYNSNKLFIGADSAGTIVPHVIGGKYFTDMLDHSAGILTAGSAIIVDNNNKIDSLYVDSIKLDDKHITITETNGDLNLAANGTGKIVFGSEVTVSAGSEFGNLRIAGNTISATDTDGDVNLTPNGSGLLKVLSNQGMLIPAGVDGTRPSAAGIPDGVIRYNTTQNRFEGTSNGAWEALGELMDLDRDTYVEVEATPDEDKIRLYTAGVQRLVVSDTGVISSVDVEAPTASFANVNISLDTIEINGSTITSSGTSSAGTIVLDPAPSAGNNGGDLIVRGNLQVTGTTTTVNSTVVEIADPIMSLGESTAIDTLDRGLELKYGVDDGEGGVTDLLAFFGWDRGAADVFTFTKDAITGSARFKDLSLVGSIKQIDGVAPTAGQLLIGNTTNGDMELSTLTGGDAITITNADGSVTVSGNRASAVSTQDISDGGDGVDYNPAADNSGLLGVATFATEQFTVTQGHVVVTVIDGGTF